MGPVGEAKWWDQLVGLVGGTSWWYQVVVPGGGTKWYDLDGMVVLNTGVGRVLYLPEGRSSALTTAISAFFLERLIILSKVNKTPGPMKKYWKNGGCTRLPLPCRIIKT